MSEKKYTQEEVDAIVNKVRIEERYIANTVMGDVGIPVNQRPPIYKEAGKIVMGMILAPPKPKDGTENTDVA